MPARRSCWPPGWHKSATTSCSSPGWTTGAPHPGRCPAATARKAARSSPATSCGQAAKRGTQLALFDTPPGRDYNQVRFDLRRGTAPGNPYLAWALHLAHVTAEARGWQPVTRRGMQRVLVAVLASYRDGEVIAVSVVRAVAGRYSISSHNAVEILATMGIMEEDRPALFNSWLDAKLADLATGLGNEARRWAVTLHDGSPRTLPRSPDTARCYVRAVRQALLAWSARYDHLREVTRYDVLSYIADVYAHERRQAVSALRSLFTWAKKTGVIFRNPASRIRLGKREHRSGSR